LTPRHLILIGFFITLAPAVAGEDLRSDLKAAPGQLSLTATNDAFDELCRRIAPSDPVAHVSLHRTFHDDFDEHPLAHGKWEPHYAGGAAWPEARYWGGDGSDFKRKTSIRSGFKTAFCRSSPAGCRPN
jgi:hypothetical protein